tara:strand:- start:2799 stop:3311 length:513 start_codon:yes stop_codon:yes gene_type:complete
MMNACMIFEEDGMAKTIFELDLVKIAVWHRRAMWLALVTILVVVSLILVSANSIAIPELVSFVVGVLWVVTLLAGVVLVVVLNRVCGSGVFETILYGIATIFLWFLILIVSISRAGTILRLAGAKPGFVGVKNDQMDKLRKGHCRGCGYSREGLELLQACPECERVPQVI